MNNLVTRVGRKIKYKVLNIIYSPDLNISEHNYSLIKLGTEYGGWTFADSDNLSNSTIISCGLGEDASFDIEFASKFNSKVVMVDPTPRAVKHHNEIMERVGMSASKPYYWRETAG